MARKRSQKETGSNCDSSSPTSSAKKRKQDDANRTHDTRRNGDSDEKKTSNSHSSPRTRSARKEETASSKKVEKKKKSDLHNIQTPSKPLHNTPSGSTISNIVTQGRNSERLKSASVGNNVLQKESRDSGSPQKKKTGRKTKQTSKECDTKDGSEQQATKNSDSEVINKKCSSSPERHAEGSSDEASVTLTPDKGRRSSSRMRKPTQKVAEAQDGRKVKVPSRASGKMDPHPEENLTDSQQTHKTDSPSMHCNQSISEPTSSINAELASSRNDQTVNESASDNAGGVVSSLTNKSNEDTENCLIDNTSETATTRSQIESTTENNDHEPDEMASMSGHQVVDMHVVDGRSSNEASGSASDKRSSQSGYTQTKKQMECHKKISVIQQAVNSRIIEFTLADVRQKKVKVRADAEVQVSLLEGKGQLVSTGTQVDDGLALPWQQLRLETEQGDGVDLLRSESQPESGSSSTSPNSIDLNAMLTMQESDEKVLGGVSALIKDSLLQIHGMRQFIIHDLPLLTHIACFQTADKIAISGTIQGISRAWSILTNIEHHVHNKGPKSKKSVKIQWTGKNGVRKEVEFKKTPQSENATKTPTKSPKPVTVFVDIKSPERIPNSHRSEVDSTPMRETGPSPQTQKHSSENWDSSGSNGNDVAQKKQISLLSGKSYSLSHIKIEGQIGVPVRKQRDDDGVGSEGDASKTPYTITVADDNQESAGGAEDIVVTEMKSSRLSKQGMTNRVRVKKEQIEKGAGKFKKNINEKASDDLTVSDDGTQTRDSSHEDNGDYDDDDDDDVIWEGKDVDNEVITVTKNGEYLCEQCPQVFISRPDLVSHRLLAHKPLNTSDNAPAFVECSTCSQRFRCRLELHRHERRAHSLVSLLPKANPVNYACNVCDKTFSEKRYLTTHLKRHTGIKRHVCSICGWRFFEAHKLKFHLETHKSEEDRHLPYRCTICQRQYHNRQSWNDHMNTHTGSKPYTCNVCGTGFAHRIGLHRHKLTHEKECQYKCTYCSRGFKVKANLRAHLTIHTGVGKHTCPVCKKVFTVATSLRRHKCQIPGAKQETKETELNEGPYMFMCGVCSMTFPTLAEAETHSLTHVDETTEDMSLVGVQVEEVGGESNILASDPNDESTTYIIEADNSGKTMLVSSMQETGNGETLVDEVEKIQMAASTLADLSTLSKDIDSLPPGKETVAAAASILQNVTESANIDQTVHGTSTGPDEDKCHKIQHDTVTEESVHT